MKWTLIERLTRTCVKKLIKNIERQWNKSSREEKNEANILGNRWKQINT